MRITYEDHSKTHEQWNDFHHVVALHFRSNELTPGQMTILLDEISQTFTAHFGRGHAGVSISERYFPGVRWCFWGFEYHFKTAQDAMLAKLVLNV